MAGSDLIYDLCERAAKAGRKGVFLLGGAEGIAVEAGRKLQSLYPGLRVVGTVLPESPGLAGRRGLPGGSSRRSGRPGPTLLFVAFGQPKGEFWIDEHLDELGVPVCVQVGATLDFVAGRVRRAPRFFQKTGLEWAYRIYTDPARLFPALREKRVRSYSRQVAQGSGQGVAQGPTRPEATEPAGEKERRRP